MCELHESGKCALNATPPRVQRPPWSPVTCEGDEQPGPEGMAIDGADGVTVQREQPGEELPEPHNEGVLRWVSAGRAWAPHAQPLPWMGSQTRATKGSNTSARGLFPAPNIKIIF